MIKKKRKENVKCAAATQSFEDLQVLPKKVYKSQINGILRTWNLYIKYCVSYSNPIDIHTNIQSFNYFYNKVYQNHPNFK